MAHTPPVPASSARNAGALRTTTPFGDVSGGRVLTLLLLQNWMAGSWLSGIGGGGAGVGPEVGSPGAGGGGGRGSCRGLAAEPDQGRSGQRGFSTRDEVEDLAGGAGCDAASGGACGAHDGSCAGAELESLQDVLRRQSCDAGDGDT